MRFKITAPDGRKVTISGDHEPSQEEASAIFDSIPAAPPDEYGPTDFAKGVWGAITHPLGGATVSDRTPSPGLSNAPTSQLLAGAAKAAARVAWGASQFPRRHVLEPILGRNRQQAEADASVDAALTTNDPNRPYEIGGSYIAETAPMMEIPVARVLAGAAKGAGVGAGVGAVEGAVEGVFNGHPLDTMGKRALQGAAIGGAGGAGLPEGAVGVLKTAAGGKAGLIRAALAAMAKGKAPVEAAETIADAVRTGAASRAATAGAEARAAGAPPAVVAAADVAPVSQHGADALQVAMPKPPDFVRAGGAKAERAWLEAHGRIPGAMQPGDVVAHKARGVSDEAIKAMVQQSEMGAKARGGVSAFPSPSGGFYNPLSGKSPAPTPGYAYHATNLENAESIAASKALKPHGPSYGTDQSAWPDGAVTKRSYFIKDPKNAGSFAPAEGQPVLLRVPSKGLSTESTGDLFSVKPVPSSQVEILGADGSWHRLSSKGLLGDVIAKSKQATVPGSRENLILQLKAAASTAEGRKRVLAALKDQPAEFAAEVRAILGR